MKNLYIAITIRENGKFHSYVLKVNNNNNLLYALEIKNIVTANYCESKKRCEEIVRVWNNQYKLNNENLY